MDDLADALGRPVALEDRRWRLLAFSAHTELEDRVRQASILARAAPPDVAAWLDTLGLEQARRGRRHARQRGDRDGSADLRARAPRRRPARPSCGSSRGRSRSATPSARRWSRPRGEAADALWAQRAAGGEAHARIAALLGELLDDPDPAVRPGRPASWRCGRAGRARAPTPYAVALAELADGDGGGRDRRARAPPLAGRRPRVAGARIGRDGRRARRDGPEALARALADAGAPHAAASAPFAELAARARGRRGRRRGPHRDPAAPGGARPRGVGRAARRVGPRGRAALGRLRPARGRRAAAARCCAPGRAASWPTRWRRRSTTAATSPRPRAPLHVHRATLYRRLARVEELAGIRLTSGDDRLRAHLALRMWRLAGSPALG